MRYIRWDPEPLAREIVLMNIDAPSILCRAACRCLYYRDCKDFAAILRVLANPRLSAGKETGDE